MKLLASLCLLAVAAVNASSLGNSYLPPVTTNTVDSYSQSSYSAPSSSFTGHASPSSSFAYQSAPTADIPLAHSSYSEPTAAHGVLQASHSGQLSGKRVNSAASRPAFTSQTYSGQHSTTAFGQSHRGSSGKPIRYSAPKAVVSKAYLAPAQQGTSTNVHTSFHHAPAFKSHGSSGAAASSSSASHASASKALFEPALAKAYSAPIRTPSASYGAPSVGFTQRHPGTSQSSTHQAASTYSAPAGGASGTFGTQSGSSSFGFGAKSVPSVTYGAPAFGHESSVSSGSANFGSHAGATFGNSGTKYAANGGYEY